MTANNVTVAGTLGPAAAGATITFAPVGFTSGVYTDQDGLLQVSASAPSPVTVVCDDAARTDTGCGTNTTTTVTDSSAVTADNGKSIVGTGIPVGAIITAVSVGTGYTISPAATATASGLTFTVGGPGAFSVILVATDNNSTDAGSLPQQWTWGLTVNATAYSPDGVQPGAVLFSAKTFPVAHANGATQLIGAIVPPPAPFAAITLAGEITRAEAAEAAEIARAEAAEVLLAPLTSPTFTGTPAVPTAAALTSTTQIASTAYADAAVAVELARAEAAEVAIPLTSTNKQAVQEATAAALPTNTYSAGVLTQTTAAVLVVDGITVALDDRILVKNEVADSNNGVYTVTTLGTGSVAYVLTRATDFSASAQIQGAVVNVEQGTINATTAWMVSGIGPFTLDTTPITWVATGSLNPVGAAATLASAGTIDPTNVVTLPVTMTGDVTGIILTPGSGDGQACNVVNTTSAHTLTFDVAGTSNVADGVSDVIPALSYRAFLWDATTSLWYRSG